MLNGGSGKTDHRMVRFGGRICLNGLNKRLNIEVKYFTYLEDSDIAAVAGYSGNHNAVVCLRQSLQHGGTQSRDCLKTKSHTRWLN